MTSFISGTTLLLGVLLVVAGGHKAVWPAVAAKAMRRAVGVHVPVGATWLTVTARGLGATELVTGAALLLGTGTTKTAAAALTTVLYVLFVPIVVVAIRRGVGCGCWGSLSEGPAAGEELGRSVALAAMAGASWLASTGPAVRLVGDGTAVVMVPAAAAVVVLAAKVGGRLLPPPSEKVQRRLRAARPTTTAGRLAWEATNLLGILRARYASAERRTTV